VTSGITCLPAVCWVLVEPGQLVDAEGPHYDNEAEALAVATAAARRHGDQPRTPMALDQPCWQAIAICGERYAGDGEFSCVHFPDETTAQDTLPADDWTTGPGGALLCSSPSCSPCGGLRSIEVPAPVVEVKGQLPLFTAQATPDSGGQQKTAPNRRDVGVSACFI
jgi:hypothetical protein